MTTADLTEKYLSEHPGLKDALREDVINYSKLARRIADDLKLPNKTSVEAILVACRRYQQRIIREESNERKILSVLRETEMQIQNKVVVLIIQKSGYGASLQKLEQKIRAQSDIFYAIEGTKVFTLITSERYAAELKALLKKSLVRTTGKLALITLKSGKSLEEVYGVTAYLYALFGERGINIVETMSCWTDTLLVIAEKDIPGVMELLRF